jgi:DNA-binding response OmpR family regulator
MKNVLLVEDNPDLQALIAADLSELYRVTTASNLAEAHQALHRESFALILLDVGLPDGDGFRFCAHLKSGKATRHLPVIFLTGSAELNDKVMGFTLGADDYLTKPFHFQELRLRIEARLRAGSPLSPRSEPSSTVAAGNLRIDLHSHRARIGEDLSLELTPVEFKLLTWLTRHLDEVFTRQQLIQSIWGGDIHVTARTVDTHVSNLRKKLIACSHAIHSVHGIGYRFGEKRASAVESIDSFKDAAS